MSKKCTFQWTAALITAIVLLGGLSLFFWKTDILSRAGDLDQLQGWLSSFAPWSELMFFFLQLSSVIVVPIPSNLMAAAGGMCFGFFRGALITFLAVSLGSFISFSLARTLGKNWVERFASQKLPAKYRGLFERKRDSFLVLAFLFPFFPDDLLCIFAGLTDISLKRFILIVLLTRPWGLFAASALGSCLPAVPAWSLPLFVIGGLLVFAAGMKYGDRVEAAILRRCNRSISKK